MSAIGFTNFYDTKMLLYKVQRNYYKGVRTGMKQVISYVTQPTKYGSQNFIILNNTELADESIKQ